MKEHWTEVFILNENMKNTEQLGVKPSDFSNCEVLYDLFNIK